MDVERRRQRIIRLLSSTNLSLLKRWSRQLLLFQNGEEARLLEITRQELILRLKPLWRELEPFYLECYPIERKLQKNEKKPCRPPLMTMVPKIKSLQKWVQNNLQTGSVVELEVEVRVPYETAHLIPSDQVQHTLFASKQQEEEHGNDMLLCTNPLPQQGGSSQFIQAHGVVIQMGHLSITVQIIRYLFDLHLVEHLRILHCGRIPSLGTVSTLWYQNDGQSAYQMTTYRSDFVSLVLTSEDERIVPNRMEEQEEESIPFRPDIPFSEVLLLSHFVDHLHHHCYRSEPTTSPSFA